MCNPNIEEHPKTREHQNMTVFKILLGSVNEELATIELIFHKCPDNTQNAWQQKRNYSLHTFVSLSVK